MIYTWHKVETLFSDMPENTPKEVVLADKPVCLLKREGHLYAFAATCPHAGAALCDGWVDARGRIVCPVHGYRFDPKNGRNTSGEGYKLRTYPAEVRNDEIFIALMPE